MTSAEPSSPNRAVGNLTFYGAAVVAGLAVCVYLAFWGGKYGLDLRVYRDSASAFLNGRNPYLLTFTNIRLAYTYPPFALPFLTAFTWEPFSVTQWAMWVVSIGATTGATATVLVDRGYESRISLWFGSFAWACVATLALEPARSGIDYGQIEFVLMFMVVADLLVVPPPFRGIVLGIAGAIKLTPLRRC